MSILLSKCPNSVFTITIQFPIAFFFSSASFFCFFPSCGLMSHNAFLCLFVLIYLFLSEYYSFEHIKLPLSVSSFLYSTQVILIHSVLLMSKYFNKYFPKEKRKKVTQRSLSASHDHLQAYISYDCNTINTIYYKHSTYLSITHSLPLFSLKLCGMEINLTHFHSLEKEISYIYYCIPHGTREALAIRCPCTNTH